MLIKFNLASSILISFLFISYHITDVTIASSTNIPKSEDAQIDFFSIPNGISDKTYAYEEIEKNNEYYYEKKSGEIANGCWFLNYSSGKTKFIVGFIDGKVASLEKFEENSNKPGTPSINEIWELGITKIYYPSNKIRLEIMPMVEKSKINIWFKEKQSNKMFSVFEYYESGGLKSEITLCNGLEEGVKKEYFFDGYLSLERTYVKGLINGTEKHYYNSGVLMKEIMYKDGKPIFGKIYTESGLAREMTNAHLIDVLNKKAK